MLLSASSIKQIQYMVIFIIVLFFIKPALFFKSNGKVRLHGVGMDEEGYKKTLYNMHFMILILAIILSIT